MGAGVMVAAPALVWERFLSLCCCSISLADCGSRPVLARESLSHAMAARFGSYFFGVATQVARLQVSLAVEFIVDGLGALPILYSLALVSRSGIERGEPGFIDGECEAHRHAIGIERK